jgi:hypothetical protein
MELSRRESLSQEFPHPLAIMEQAYKKIKDNKNVIAGSSTVCIMTFGTF